MSYQNCRALLFTYSVGACVVLGWTIWLFLTLPLVSKVFEIDWSFPQPGTKAFLGLVIWLVFAACVVQYSLILLVNFLGIGLITFRKWHAAERLYDQMVRFPILQLLTGHSKTWIMLCLSDISERMGKSDKAEELKFEATKCAKAQWEVFLSRRRKLAQYLKIPITIPSGWLASFRPGEDSITDYFCKAELRGWKIGILVFAVCLPAYWLRSHSFASVCLGEQGLAHFQQKNYYKALYEFNEAISLDPKHSWLYAYRASTYDALGKHDLAQRDRAKAQSFVSRP